MQHILQKAPEPASRFRVRRDDMTAVMLQDERLLEDGGERVREWSGDDAVPASDDVRRGHVVAAPVCVLHGEYRIGAEKSSDHDGEVECERLGFGRVAVR